MSYLFFFSRYQIECAINFFLDNWWHHKQGKNEGKTEMYKHEYLTNEKNFLDETKSIFHNYERAIIW